jgi:hypothetical protein
MTPSQQEIGEQYHHNVELCRRPWCLHGNYGWGTQEALTLILIKRRHGRSARVLRISERGHTRDNRSGGAGFGTSGNLAADDNLGQARQP